MTSATPNRLFSFLLPKLRKDSDVRADINGAWSLTSATTFQNVATSLDYKAPGRSLSVSSVPTMWARPLSVEMALHNPGHPAREHMVAEWQGMLGAIAFAAMHGYPLSVKRLQIEQYRYHPFARSLEKLLPDPTNALYDCRETGDNHPWRDIFIFYWQDRPVGITSPSTIVTPSASADWGFVRWWRDGRLNAPSAYLNQEEKEQLWLWLDNLLRRVTDASDTGNLDAINTMVKLINEFRASLLPSAPKDNLLLSNNPQFFGMVLNRGVLTGLNSPIKAPSRPSSVALISNVSREIDKPLLLVDPEISNRWGFRAEDIQIHQDKTLSAIDIAELEDYKKLWKDVVCVSPEDLFLPNLKFIDHMTNAIPGGLMSSDPEQTLTFAGETITPLIPLNPLLLNYLTPEYLHDNLRFRALGGGDPLVEVTLDLQLSGIKESMNHRIVHTYELKPENALDGVPVLEIWPNIKSANWHEYYAFYFDAGLGKDTFQVDFADCDEKKIFKDNQGGAYAMAKLKEFPASIQCLDESQQVVGLILLRQPDEIFPSSTWKVGVDFGTSFTNVYVSRSGAEQLELESLNLKVVDSPPDTRFTTLFEYFVPENFIPTKKPLPLSSIMTRRGSGQGNNSGKQQIIDGRIYVPDVTVQPKEEWIETDLKWSNIASNRLFLRHLILHISALALKKSVNKIEWYLSYPSAFSRRDRSSYAKSWSDITKALSETTGITHVCSDNASSDHYKTESLAVAQYFADQEEHDLTYTTCIDMGGGTSDISVWESNTLIHQCSIQLAGRDLLSGFIRQNPAFIERCKFKINAADWKGLTPGAFHAKLDVLLRWDSEEWLNDIRPQLTDDDEFQGLIQLTSLGISGMYYYVGLILRALHKESKYQEGKITPVYLGGNGSRLMHWLDSTGRFASHSEINDLLSRILSCASGFEDTEVPTRLSKNPKDEVACGLVLSRTRLTGFGKRVKDPIIAGEYCEVNGAPILGGERLAIEEDVSSFQIPEFNQLIKFMDDYHTSLNDLDIDSIYPLKGYKRSLEPADNKKLWEGTRRALSQILTEGSFKGDYRNIRVEPPFILCLKAMLNYLGKEWSGR